MNKTINLSDIKHDDCLTVYYGDNPYMQSTADHILSECLELKPGYRITCNDTELATEIKVVKDIKIQDWVSRHNELEEAVNKHLKNNAHIFHENGVYVGDGLHLHFDKEEYNKKFGNGYYVPDVEGWLMKNAKVVKL